MAFSFTNKRFSLTARLYLLLSLALLGASLLCTVGAVTFYHYYHQTRFDRGHIVTEMVADFMSVSAETSRQSGDDRLQTQKKFLEMLARSYSDESEYFFVSDMFGTVLFHPIIPSLVGRNALGVETTDRKMILRDMIALAKENGSGFYEYMWSQKLEDGHFLNPEKRISYFKFFPEWNWLIARSMSFEETPQIMWELLKTPATICTSIICFFLFILFIIGRSIAIPISVLDQQIQRMAEGDMSQTIKFKDRNDEIGSIARNVQSFAENLKQLDCLDAEREQMEAMKNEFISVVSHELRTPLTSIRGSLGLIAGTMAKQIPDQANQLISIASKNCERLILLINDILDINKIASGQMRFDMKTENIADLVKQAVEANRAYAEKYFVRYECKLPDHPVFIYIDAHRFTQVLSNLLSNAAKFSPGGGKVDVIAAVSESHIRLTVKDYGLGIPDEFKPKIFGKFAQADSSATRQVGGTGLGLFISKQLVEQMNGVIGFDSKRGLGAEFWIEFQTCEAEDVKTKQSMDIPRPHPHASAQSGLPLILHVEHDLDFCRILSKKFEGLAILEPVIAMREIEFFLQSRDVSLVILDIQMPSYNGLDLIDRIPFMAKKMLPMIVLSGSSDIPDDIKGRVSAVLVKGNINEDDIVKCVLKHLPKPQTAS